METLEFVESWRRKQSSANPSLPARSLFHGKIQGNSPDFGLEMTEAPRPSEGIQSFSNRIP
jgi:hypothetical protein